MHGSRTRGICESGCNIRQGKGPHIPCSGKIKAIKLLNIAGAYWRGDESRKQLTRIYGVSFPKQKELTAHLELLEEAKKRDHRKLGRELGLFLFHHWAPGAPFWLAKGTILYNLLADYMREVLWPAGYVELKTPIVYNKALWETSGHWEHYRENMFLVESTDSQPMGVKAMNCPGHMLVFASEVRSYRDLPIRFHEQTPLHRNEASGVLAGLIRVRQFAQDDAHCFVTEDQIGEEVARLLRLVERVYGDFDLTPVLRLSTRPVEFLGESAQWDHAETQLKEALAEVGLPYTVDEGDGAFYGPKVDIQFTTLLGREESMSTIQLDFAAKERFSLTYKDETGAENGEVFVIHRAPLSTHERFVAFLTEHWAGSFPTWLSPVQVQVITISEKHREYAAEVREALETAGVRVQVDDSDNTIGKKIRMHRKTRPAYMVILGDEEASDRTVSIRGRGGNQKKGVGLDEFVSDVFAEISNRSRELSLDE